MLALAGAAAGLALPGRRRSSGATLTRAIPALETEVTR
jgi:hypothetical protein